MASPPRGEALALPTEPEQPSGITHQRGTMTTLDTRHTRDVMFVLNTRVPFGVLHGQTVHDTHDISIRECTKHYGAA